MGTRELSGVRGTQFTCFTGTKVQILTLGELRRKQMYSVYQLYWYKSTDTDTGGAERWWNELRRKQMSDLTINYQCQYLYFCTSY